MFHHNFSFFICYFIFYFFMYCRDIVYRVIYHHFTKFWTCRSFCRSVAVTKLRSALTCCLFFLLFLRPNRLILCLPGVIFGTYLLAILTWVGARACLWTLLYFAKKTRPFGSCTRLGFGSLRSKILFLVISIPFCSSFSTAFFSPNYFFSNFF